MAMKKFFYSKKLASTVLVLGSVMLSLFLGEFCLRMLGYQPSIYKKTDGFEKVDSLIEYKNFTTDELGIYKFSTWVSDSFPKYFDPKSGKIENELLANSLYNIDQIDYVHQSFFRLSDPDAFNTLHWIGTRWYQKDDESTRTANFYRSLLKKVQLSFLDSAIVAYLKKPFNEEGFRSISFKAKCGNKKRILLIGDSFVYGMCARPFYNSFYDILLSEGYCVFNAGIPGTDPAQYAAIAEKYVPLLKPDLVIVCFYPGNDYMQYERKVSSGFPHEHIINAGFLSSNVGGNYYSAEEVYHIYLKHLSIPETTMFNRLCCKSVISTLLWSILAQVGLVEQPCNLAINSMLLGTDKTIITTKKYVDRWNEICTNNGARHINIIIPEYFGKKTGDWLQPNIDIIDSIFEASCIYPDSFSFKNDFPKGDYHFNNTGHKKFAKSLANAIDETD
jgi:hypothetical protein